MSSDHFLQMPILYAFPACFIAFLYITIHKKRGRKLPPGPMRLPVVGNLHQLGNPLHETFRKLANVYGDLMFLQLGSVPTLVVSSADVAREMFRTHDLVLSGRPELYVAKRLSYNCSNISFSPYGEHWREVRKIAVLELLSAKRVQSFDTVREEEVKNMLSSVVGVASSSGLINLSELASVFANNVFCRVAFGKKYEGGGSGVHDILLEAQDLLGGVCIADFLPWMSWINKFNGLDARLDNNFGELDRLFDKVLQEHLDPERPKPEQEDLVDVLIRVQKDANLTTNSIKGVLLDMYIAGTDTSTATIVWTMTELLRNPLVMKRAEEEVRKITKERVEESDLSQLVYLKSVVKETLRLHPPAPLLIPRETTEDCNISGYQIPAKTRVFINASSILQDHRSWENPLEYRPERFLDSPIDFRGQHFEFIPFGVGRRGCPGINFGVLLVELALANLLHSFDWKLPHGMAGEDLDMEGSFGITVHKKIPLCLIASPSGK